MHCENCWKAGYTQEQVTVDQVRRIFVGPCCPVAPGSQVPSPVTEEPTFEYGIMITSRRGIVAFAQYGGLSIQYHKDQDEIRDWFEGFRGEQAA